MELQVEGVRAIMSRTQLPVEDLRYRIDAVRESLAREGGPVGLTQDGVEVALLLTPEAYEAMLDRIALLEGCLQGHADFARGDVCTHDEAMRWLARRRT